MVDSRTLVKQALTFSSPSRVPRDIWVLPWAGIHYPRELAALRERFPNDIVGAPGFHRQPYQTQGDQYGIGTYVDEWGCAFENIQPGVIGEVKQPLLADWANLPNLRPPLEALTVDVEQVNNFCRASDQFITAGCCPRPFERMQFIRGSENLYFDLADESGEFETLLHTVHEFYLRELELWAQTEVDGLTFMDDWGAQRSLLISPKQWRRLFKPLYKDYIDLAHAHGKFIFMHSDGFTQDIIPDLIELGLDALNTQLFTMDIEELGRRFRGQLTFWGEIDRQHLLPFGTLAEVDQAVRRVQAALYCNGGVIAQCEFSAGGRPENVWQVFETWEKLIGV